MPVRLLVPGLLGPLPVRSADLPIPRMPFLERVLARAVQAPAPSGYAASLFALYGRDMAGAVDLPTAPVCYLADTGQAAPGYLLHADPVYLRPDQDRLLLFGGQDLDLDAQQAEAFASAFNSHFADAGLSLLVPHPARWYLHVAHAPRLRTAPLDDVIGRNIDLFLPRGEDARHWRALLNEVQMLFHGLAVNAGREARGQVPIAGLWLSGGGEPIAGTVAPTAAAPTADVLQRGLQAWLGPASGGDVRVERRAWHALVGGDMAAWLAALTDIERQVGDLLERRQAWSLYPADGRVWHWHPRAGLQFWRRPRPLCSWLAPSA